MFLQLNGIYVLKLSNCFSNRGNNDTHIYNVDVKGNQLPIVYSDEYNITFGGLQKLHPFDSEKWGRIAGYLKGKHILHPV